MDEDFVRKIFVACDQDQDGYLDRSDLEEVRKQIGLEGNISEILEQFGATQSGKISFNLFCEKSSVLFGDLNQSSSESSPEYFTDSDTQLSTVAAAVIVPMEKDRVKNKKEETHKITQKQKDKYLQHMVDLDLELDIGSEKLKKISESWASRNPQRRSGGGIEDYLDEKTLQHLEELNIIDPQPPDKIFMNSSSAHDEKEESGADCFQISKIAKQVHLAALTSYENKIHMLTNRLHQIKKERDHLKHQQTKWEFEKQKLQQDFEDKLQSQTMRITELQSVIAELTRKLNKTNANKIIEEEEEEEEDGEDEHGEGEHDDDDARSRSTSDLEVQGSHADCSDCSCDNCCHQLEDQGPNQVNFLATATQNEDTPSVAMQRMINEQQDVPISALDINDDLQNQLHRVLGALESRIEDRRHSKPDDEGIETRHESPFDEQRENDEHSKKFMDDMIAKETQYRTQMNTLIKMVDTLKKEKRSLEKQLHNMNVQGYVYQKGNTTHVEDEFNKLRQENTYLRSKLKKYEQELEDTRGSLIIVREEKERLKKKARNFQESLAGKISPSPSTESIGSGGHRRSSSVHITDHRSTSPSATPCLQRSTSSMVERPNTSQRSLSLGSRSQSNPGKSSPDSRPRGLSQVHKYSPTSNTGSNTLPHTQSSAFVSFNSKGYLRSPENTLPRGQHVETSDLGSSIGSEGSRNELNKALLQHFRNRVPDSLLQSLLSFNNIENVLKLVSQHFVAELEEKSREGMINVERLESRMSHLHSQNDLLQLSLEESKQNSERLSLLCGKYESNSTAWSLALQNTEHLIETYEVLLQLQESEADIFAANCLAAGIAGNFDTIKSLTSTKSSISNISIASSLASSSVHQMDDEEIYKNSHNKRKDAESHAKLLLHELDKKFENSTAVDNVHDFDNVHDLKSDELSYHSRTSTGSSQNSATTDTLSKDEQHRLRDYVRLLKQERGVCKGTVIELESIHQYSDPNDGEPAPSTTSTYAERSNELNLDLETAVTFQEMQGLKEERAELKHRIYLLEKEKRSLELKMNSREAQEQAYIVHIEHLKSEVKEQIKKRKNLLKDGSRRSMQPSLPEDQRSLASCSTHSTNPDIYQTSSNDDIPGDLMEASRRERKLKQKIQDLFDTLEKLSKNSDIRQRQTAEYISDLKRANGALVTAYEKAKKRHASRLKKFEQQLVQMAEKYQIQMRTLKEQIVVLKETPTSSVPQTETSL